MKKDLSKSVQPVESSELGTSENARKKPPGRGFAVARSGSARFGCVRPASGASAGGRCSIAAHTQRSELAPVACAFDTRRDEQKKKIIASQEASFQRTWTEFVWIPRANRDFFINIRSDVTCELIKETVDRKTCCGSRVLWRRLMRYTLRESVEHVLLVTDSVGLVIWTRSRLAVGLLACTGSLPYRLTWDSNFETTSR
ncbi:hypothetical protein EVAR_92161_1 [Eumeta japonica]|uniref:Uncharacterized protein n=1 Tax=Eumeta variegata TaxID=151549 RepID=A0A4C1SZI5_EUMVA|nr:hypothetical protein EVAR_92161_1 [Eumeta japonica]